MDLLLKLIKGVVHSVDTCDNPCLLFGQGNSAGRAFSPYQAYCDYSVVDWKPGLAQSSLDSRHVMGEQLPAVEVTWVRTAR